MINFLELRRGMMVLSNTIDKLRRSRELSSSKTNMQTAQMWVGNYLKFSGLGDNPYAENDGKRKTVDDIKPTFDFTAESLDKEVLDQGLIYVVDQMREYLGNNITKISEYMLNMPIETQEEPNPLDVIQANMCMFNIYTYLSQSRMWLGMELARIREEGEDAPEVKL